MPEAKILLIGTKSDLLKEKEKDKVSPEVKKKKLAAINTELTLFRIQEIEEIKKEIGAYEFIQCSAMTGENVDAVLHLLYKAYKSKVKKFTMKKVVGFFSRKKSFSD